MAYILDTGIIVDVLRWDAGAIEYVDCLDFWGYSVISAMELVAGVRKQGRDPRS